MSSDPTSQSNTAADPTLNKDTDPSQSGNQAVLEAQHKFFNVTVITPSGSKIQIQTSLEENVQDLKQMLFESKEVCFITSYSLLFNDQEINDFAELASLEGLEEGSVFTMLQAEYTTFGSRVHVRRLRDILYNSVEKPLAALPGLMVQVEKEEREREAKESKQIKKAAPQNNNNKKTGGKKKKNKGKGKRQNKSKQQQQQSNKEELKPEESSKFENFGINFGEANPEDLFPPKPKSIKCLQSLDYSGWNLPPPNRYCKGDLAYLVVKTLENRTFHITATSNGFYVNGSTETSFNPRPAEAAHFSHTLVEVLERISPLFKSKFNDLLEKYFSRHPFEVIQVPIEELNTCWLDVNTEHTNDINRTQTFLSGEDFRFPDQLRDWNAEYQSCRELPKEDAQERVFRDRSIAKVTNEFVNAAIIGARAIVNGTAQPLNPTEPVPAHLYIYNNIFFSHALNGRFAYDEGEGDMGPYKRVNNDLKGVALFSELDNPEIHSVLTVLINLKGFRIVAQSIIPGILHQTGINCIQYGSIDNGNALAWNEEFHELLKSASDKLRIPEHEVEDENGNRTTICFSTESKGVLGTDGRKYVLDLDHTIARDLNFDEKWALVRPELYEIYSALKKHQFIMEHKDLITKKEIQKRKKLEKSKSEGESKEDNDEEEEEEIQIPEFIEPKFNPNVFIEKKFKVVGEGVNEAEEKVKELSKFLIENIIPSLVSELGTTAYPTDSNTLKSTFHSHGVNLRYLGKVVSLLKNEKQFLKDLMVREMIVRSTKFIFHDIIRTSGHGKVAHNTSHFLNCFIRGAFTRNYNNPNGTPITNDNQTNGLTPSSLWKQIEEQVKKHFRYELKKEEFQAAKFILPTLRTLCQMTGIRLLAKTYDFYSIEPISEDDIMGLSCVVKYPVHSSKDGTELLDGGKSYMLKGRLDIAFEFLMEALSIFHQTYGPLHPQTSTCYSHLALVLNQAGDIGQSVLHQTKTLIILERTRGLDHHETAYEYGSLGMFYHQAGNSELALYFTKRAIFLSTLIGGEFHPDNGGFYYNIGGILQGNNEHKKAIEFYEQSINCFDYHFGPKHITIANAQQNIAISYAGLHQYRLAIQHEKKALDIYNDILNANDHRILGAKEILNRLTAKAVENEKSQVKKPAKVVTNTSENVRVTDEDIGTLPIKDIMKYINNTERSSRVKSRGGRSIF